jgi:dihydrofolate reductase
MMSHVIVIEFVSLDGVMQDPDGNEGFSHGGWAFRYGPEPVSGDPFGLSEVLDTGALLLGRRTWQMFAGIWPGRDDPFSAKMNAMPKLVMSRSLEHAGGWQNSTVLRGDLVTEAGKRKQEQDIVVMGSASVVHALTAHDLVDEYRLLVFPLVIGTGTRLFPDGTAPADLAPVSVGTKGAAARLIYTRSGNSLPGEAFQLGGIGRGGRVEDHDADHRVVGHEQGRAVQGQRPDAGMTEPLEPALGTRHVAAGPEPGEVGG